MRPEEPLPHNSIPSKKKFAIFAPDEGLISEHDFPSEAVKAFAKLATERRTSAAIYRKGTVGWKVY